MTQTADHDGRSTRSSTTPDLRSAGMLLLMMAVLCFGITIPAAGQTDAARPVLLLTPADAQLMTPPHDDLLQALTARLAALAIPVLPRERPDHFDDTAIAELAAQQAAWSVLWLSDDGSQLFVLTPELGDTVRARPLTGLGDTWVSKYEAVASVIYGEIQLAMTQATLAEQAPAPPDVEPEPDETGSGSDETGRGPAVSLTLSLGYAPTPLSAGGPVIHALALGAGVWIGPYLGVQANVDLSARIPLDANGGQASAGRWPVRLALAGRLSLGRFEPGGRVGAVVEVLRARDMGMTPADPDALGAHLDIGLALALRAVYRVLPWLAPSVGVGVDLFALDRRFLLEGDVLLHRPRAVIRLVVGLTFVLDVSAH